MPGTVSDSTSRSGSRRGCELVTKILKRYVGPRVTRAARHRTPTWSGKPISPNNVLRRWIAPACETLGLKRVSWLTLRRTYSSWTHAMGVWARSSRSWWGTRSSTRGW